MKRKYLSIVTGFFLFMTAANPAWAVQAHGGAEGLVSHQIGHLLFTIGMAYMIIRLRATPPREGGWLEFKIFIWLLIAWNIMTFSGHWMNEFVTDDKFLHSQAGISSFRVDSVYDAIYYLTRLDHLILVPSFAFLLLALRKWRMQL